MAINNSIRNNLVSVNRPTSSQVITNPSFNGLRLNDNVERIVQAEEQRVRGGTFLNFPFDLPKYYFGIVEFRTGWAGANPIYGQNLTPIGGYRFPLPTTLTDGYEVQYDHGFNWLQFLGLGAAERTVSQVLGFAVNNFKQVTIQAPQFRQYSLEWKLAPRSKEESARIKEIEMKIKKGMHPVGNGYIPGTNINNLVLTFPNVFQCFFMPNAEYMYNFKPAVITGFTMDYQGGNHRSIFYKESGAPESVILKLSMLEIDYWASDDFNRSLFPTSRAAVANSTQQPNTQEPQLPFVPFSPTNPFGNGPNS